MFLETLIKTLSREEQFPKGAHRALQMLAPALALFPIMVAFAVIPWANQWCAGGALLVVDQREVCLGESRSVFSLADLDIGALYLLGALSLSIFAQGIAGWASNSQLALIRALRDSAQMISFDLSVALSTLGVVLIFGTLNLNEMVLVQGALIWGFLPSWGIFLQPLGALIFLAALMARSLHPAFLGAELGGEHLAESSSLGFATAPLLRVLTGTLVSAMTAVFFLGGWQVPYLYGDGFQAPSSALFLVSGSIFLVLGGYLVARARKSKARVAIITALSVALASVASFGLFLASARGFVALPYPLVVFLRLGAMVGKVFLVYQFLQIRWTFPRFDHRQIMRLGWKVFFPAALLNLLVTVLALTLFF